MLPTRDYTAEKEILNAFCAANVNFAVLQPDWENTNHGDLDIVADNKNWQLIIETLTQYVRANNYHLVKAYEIEFGVICLVILTHNNTVFLDIALTPFCKKVFGLHLNSALKNKDNTHAIPVICKNDFDIYRNSKKAFKKNKYKKWLKKISNLAVITRRLMGCSILIRGAFIYIPYITDTHVLKSKHVIKKVSQYLTGTLLSKYR